MRIFKLTFVFEQINENTMKRSKYVSIIPGNFNRSTTGRTVPEINIPIYKYIQGETVVCFARTLFSSSYTWRD